jgi:hypothetical protein
MYTWCIPSAVYVYTLDASKDSHFAEAGLKNLCSSKKKIASELQQSNEIAETKMSGNCQLPQNDGHEKLAGGACGKNLPLPCRQRQPMTHLDPTKVCIPNSPNPRWKLRSPDYPQFVLPEFRRYCIRCVLYLTDWSMPNSHIKLEDYM